MIKKFNLDGWEIDTHNKYGYLIHRRTEPGDFEFMILDENCCILNSRKEARELEIKIINEDRRQAKKELIGLLAGDCTTYTETSLRSLLWRLGIGLYIGDKPRDFGDVFEDIVLALKEVE